MPNDSQIQKFFENKTVCVTGATGFLGKLLVEKILRTCDIKKMYITMRPKKNKRIVERMEIYFNSVLFDRLKTERGNVLDKVEVIGADLILPDLGINESDRKVLINEVNVMLHNAATVSLDETLRVAAYTNVRGTEELLKLCTELKHLISVVYVSTAYSNCIKSETQEEFYTPPLTSGELLTIVNAFDDKTLEAITPHILGSWPNTYVFTKSIAEECVRQMGSKLPITVVRPSIVACTAAEPVRGWIDNYYNITGVFVGVSLGVIRTLNCNANCVGDLIPADYVVNLLLVAAAKVPGRQNEDVPIYHCVTSYQNQITWNDVRNYNSFYSETFPTHLQMWHMMCVLSTNKHMFALFSFALHTVPAYAIDFVLLYLGKSRQAVMKYQKISKFVNVLAYFATRQWIFDDKNTQNLWGSLNKTDRAIYPFDKGMLPTTCYIHSDTTHALAGGQLLTLKQNKFSLLRNEVFFNLVVRQLMLLKTCCYYPHMMTFGKIPEEKFSLRECFVRIGKSQSVFVNIVKAKEWKLSSIKWLIMVGCLAIGFYKAEIIHKTIVNDNRLHSLAY
ncbi:hypothetical protein FQA39_LY14267 [Lamprigera yunnana]|nr:hypothetical protein FQA39_LY14267 [Lamprigera yunnana]